MKYLKNLKNKKTGSLHMVVLALGLFIFTMFLLDLVAYKHAATSFLIGAKAQCDFSNLAAYKEIDQDELASSGDVTFRDTDLNNVYLTFKSYLIENLHLDSNMMPVSGNTFITSPYDIKRVIVYSVKGGLCSEWEYTNVSHMFNTVLTDYSGEVKTPTGRTVTHTAIYTEVNYTIKLPFQTNYSNYIVSFTDIVK